MCVQHVVSCRVENTRVNPDSLIDELLAATDLKQAVDDAAESEYRASPHASIFIDVQCIRQGLG